MKKLSLLIAAFALSACSTVGPLDQPVTGMSAMQTSSEQMIAASQQSGGADLAGEERPDGSHLFRLEVWCTEDEDALRKRCSEGSRGCVRATSRGRGAMAMKCSTMKQLIDFLRSEGA